MHSVLRCDHIAGCGALNENVPHSLGHLNTWSPAGGCLWRTRRCGLAGRYRPLGVDFEVSKDSYHFELAFPFPACGSTRDLSWRPFLTSCLHSPAMDSNPLDP